MLIRSQEKMNLINLNNVANIHIECYYTDYEDYEKILYTPSDDKKANIFLIRLDSSEWRLGTYSTKEKAIKVLDMIQETYRNEIYCTPNFAINRHLIFDMPQDSEVKV